MATKDYAAIAKRTITHPSAGDRMPRILVYARNKKGKTRFCTSAPDVLMLDPEDGTREEQKADPDTWPVSSWEDVHDAAGFLKSRANKSPRTGRPYQWCAWDGVTRIYDVAMKFIRNRERERDLGSRTADGDKTQRDYGKANDLLKDALHQFHAIRNMGMIFTAQERMIEISSMEDLGDDEDATPAAYMYVPDLPKGARGPFNQVVDVIGRLYVVRGEGLTVPKRFRKKGSNEVIIKQVPSSTQRRLWIAPHEMYDTGFRSDHELPDFIKNPTVETVTRAIRNGEVE